MQPKTRANIITRTPKTGGWYPPTTLMAIPFTTRVSRPTVRSILIKLYNMRACLIQIEEESGSGNDLDSNFDSTGSLTSEDTMTSTGIPLPNPGACSYDWNCCQCTSQDHCRCSDCWNCDHCINKTISGLKMEREACLQNVELWEKALLISFAKEMSTSRCPMR